MVKRDILISKKHIQYLRSYFYIMDCRDVITIDMDFSLNGNYLTFNVHWTDYKWILQKRIIEYKIYKHEKTGSYIAQTVGRIL